MAFIPVWVQQPNKHPGHEVGAASDLSTAEEVARKVGVPDGCLLDGKIIKHKGDRRWSLVADVTFRERQ